MEASEKLEIKKVLVKCPDGSDKAFSLFPFMEVLSEEFPGAEIFTISEESDSFAFNFLPFKVKAFERPRDKKNFLKTHQYCANLHDIFNIDVFFDLENNFNSSFMGYNFRSTHRVGYETGWNKYFLNHKFKNDEAITLEKKSLRLLENYTGKYFNEVAISRSKGKGQEVEAIEQLFKLPEQPSFVMIMLDNLDSVLKQVDIWKAFFDSFHNQKFIIFALENEVEISELFSKIDLGHNSLYMHRGANSQELLYIMNKVKGVVVNNLWAEGLCTYVGMNHVSFMVHTNSMLPRYDHFKFKPQRFTFTPGAPIHYSYLDEERDYAAMNEIVDYLHFQFKL